jgi:SpoVK/Ycf46/Vps4 family AAA+-type ATPase
MLEISSRANYFIRKEAFLSGHYSIEDEKRSLMILYRRGILLHGPPGTGKTSTVMAIAGELGMDIFMINLSSKRLSDENLLDILHKVYGIIMMIVYTFSLIVCPIIRHLKGV